MKKFKEWVEIFSKLATIGIFVLAVFGYFYTVKPKFELDNLKFSMKEVKKEKDILNEQIISFSNNLDILKQEKTELKSSLNKFRNEKEVLKSDLVKYQIDKNEMQNELKDYKKVISKKESYIYSINKKINNLNTNLFVSYLFNGVDPFNDNISDTVKFSLSNLNDRMERSEKYKKLIEISLKEKALLQTNSPYNKLMEKIEKLVYKKEMLLTKREFNKIKKVVTNIVKQNKNELKYDNKYFYIVFNEINSKRLELINLLKRKQKELTLLEREEKELSNEDVSKPVGYFNKKNKVRLEDYNITIRIIRNHSEYDNLIIKENRKVQKIIKDFIEKSIL